MLLCHSYQKYAAIFSSACPRNSRAIPLSSNCFLWSAEREYIPATSPFFSKSFRCLSLRESRTAFCFSTTSGDFFVSSSRESSYSGFLESFFSLSISRASSFLWLRKFEKIPSFLSLFRWNSPTTSPSCFGVRRKPPNLSFVREGEREGEDLFDSHRFSKRPIPSYYPILVTKAIYCCGYRWRFWSESCCSARVRFLDMRSPMIPREKSVTPIVMETPEIKSDCIISRPIFVNIYAWINRSTHTSPRRREGRLRIKNTFRGS